MLRKRFPSTVKAAFRDTPVSIFLDSLTFISQPVISQKTAAFCLSKANLVVANSASVASKVKRRFPGVSHKTKHVHLGVDMDLFRPPTPWEREKWRRVYGVKGSFTVAYAGRLIPRKGIPLLIKAMRQVRMTIPKARLLIAGGSASGSYGVYLHKTAAVHKVPAKFIGTLPHRKVRQAYWAADCFVCPSQKHEAFGLVNVESMACGLPAIASRNGGIREIIRHKRCGLLVDGYRRPSSFAAAILSVARSRSFGRKLGLQARKDMKHKFSWSRTARELTELYRRNFNSRLRIKIKVHLR